MGDYTIMMTINIIIKIILNILKKFIPNFGVRNDDEIKPDKISTIENKHVDIGLPVEGSYRITSKYGWRWLKWNGKRRKNFHNGIDIGGARNIYAPEDIKILKIVQPDKKYPSRFKWTIKGWVNSAPKGRAWTPVIETIGLHTKTIYKFKHIKPWGMVVGDTVDYNSKIGRSDNLGFSMGAHLHFETWINNKNGKHKNIDPIKYYKKYGVRV